MNRYFRFLFLFVLCLSVSCGSGPVEQAENKTEKSLQSRFDESLFSVELRDGVRHVHNQSAQWGDAQKLKLEPVLTIGELDGMDENVLFHKPYDFAVAPDGTIAIVDAGNFRVQKFSAGGEFLASFGRKGQGPGEFQMMGGMTIDEQGRMYIADLTTNTIKVFSSEGQMEKQIPVFRHKGPVLRLPSGSFVLGDRMIMGSDIVPALLHIFNGEGKEETSFGEVHRYEDFDEYRYFNRISYTADEEGLFYLAYGTRNLIEKYDVEGNRMLCMDRPLNFAISQKVEKVKRQVGPRQIEIPEVNMVSGDVAVDSKGRIWVLSYERQLKFEERSLTIVFADEDGNLEDRQKIQTGEKSKIDAFAFHVFSNDGIFLGKIPLDHYGGRLKIAGGRLYLLEPDHDVCLYVYDIVEN